MLDSTCDWYEARVVPLATLLFLFVAHWHWLVWRGGGGLGGG